MAPLTYKTAGVDIETADKFVANLARKAKVTYSPQVLKGIGPFAAAFAPDLSGMKRPVLVSGADGVGTKLKLAFQTGVHNTVGVDLVAMSVNDVLTTGARPLFFLDYVATGKIDPKVLESVLEGIVEGCLQASCALIGGETAEMPDFYPQGEYDLAGFAVGLVDEDQIVDGSTCEEGDIIIGLPSSGLHSNGFSLVRRIIELRGLDLNRTYQDFDRPLGEVLLTPTRIYVAPVLDLLSRCPLKAMAHITGGGIPGNLPRVLPDGLAAIIERDAIPYNPIFRFIQGRDIEDNEMWRVFNMGVGFIIIVSQSHEAEAIASLTRAGEKPFVLGRLVEGQREVVIR